MAARHKRVYTYINRQKCVQCSEVTGKWTVKQGKYYCKKCGDDVYGINSNDSKMNEQSIQQSNNDIVDNGLYSRDQVEEYVQTFRNKIEKLQRALNEKRNSLKEERIKTANLENRVKKMRVKFANDRWNVESFRKQLEQEKIKSSKLQEKITELLSNAEKKEELIVHVDGNKMEWKSKKIEKWSNNDILHWINSLNFENKWNNKLMQEIKHCQCNGKDIAYLKSAQEVGESFDIEENEELCNELFAKIKILKNGTNKQSDDKDNGNRFEINIFSQDEYITLNQKVTANCSVGYVKEIYKKQTGVVADINDIHFYCKMKLLPSNQTLWRVNIIDDKHLITVKFGTDGAVSDDAVEHEPRCICGSFLNKKKIEECYNSGTISCDKCMRYINRIGDEYVYHCVNGVNISHVRGYDICMECAQTQ